MKLVVVKFYDPTTFGSWVNIEDILQSKPRVCYAAGWLVNDDKDLVKVALLSSDDKESMSNWIDIPRACVLSVDFIKEIDWGGEDA